MRTILLAAVITLGACATDIDTAPESGKYINALTGETCTPDGTYLLGPGNGNGNGNRCQGTGNGDNCDDLASGQIDCIGDGNSGQGDDKKHECEFPQPGCDANACCDHDIVAQPPGGWRNPPWHL